MNGHELARQIIDKHGIDRYPDKYLQALKVMEEIGELTGELLKNPDGPGVLKEYADVGLALYALGNKLGIDLDDAMRQVIGGETRTFAKVTVR